MMNARYATVMVGVDLGVGTEARVGFATAIASRSSGLLIGVAAESLPFSIYTEGGEVMDETLIEAETERAFASLAEAERLFRKAAAPWSADWRQSVADPSAFLVAQAAAADLLVVGRRGPDDPAGGRMAIDPGTVIIKAGRPMLLVPPRDSRRSARRVLVAWKDTAEARRAVADALPFIAGADEVTVMTVGEARANNGLKDICSFLDRHGVAAKPLHLLQGAATVADEIITLAQNRGTDLLVAGAYSHSRIREWALGGVTRELLRRTPCACLFSR